MDELSGQIETFGRYGFNKSHSVAYSVLSYQTAWLKAHHPAEFMAALLSACIGDTDTVVQYINEARDMGLEVLPPDVNESGYKFTVVGPTRIRFGLGAVRNVGRGAIDSIIAAREGGKFATIADLADRIDLRLANRRVFESLIGAGACDSLDGHRAQLIANIETVLGEASLQQQERDAGQESLFGEAQASKPTHSALAPVPIWPEAERLAREKDVLGFFISGHPLEKYRTEVELFSTRTTATLSRWSEHQVTLAAVVTLVKRQISKKTGKEYARVTVEDFHGTAEAIVFPEAWAKLSQTIKPDLAMLLTGGYSARDRGEEVAPFVVEGAQALDDLRKTGSVALTLRWKGPNGITADVIRSAAALCAAHPGAAPVYIEWTGPDGTLVRLRSRRHRIEPEDEVVSALRGLLGSDSVMFVKA
jgi:DNA polymerase-3 subunit alpha